jgi:hypothetical protein
MERALLSDNDPLVMAGAMTNYPVADDAADYKGRVIIEWPYSSAGGPANQVLPSVLTSVRDAETGELIPAAKIAVHADASNRLITADIAVFLDRRGEILHDPYKLSRESDGIPASFPFLVAGMRNGTDSERPA